MDPQDQPIVLASQSPRRKDLLLAAGLQVHVRAVACDEFWQGGDAAACTVAIARQKLRAARKATHHEPELLEAMPWVAADTAVICDGEVLGKPRDDDHAKEMLQQLSGTAHEVVTGYVMRFCGVEQARAITTRVVMRQLSDAEIEAYVATGEPRDKAGSYGIQGLGGALVDSISGSYTNVVGLPLKECLQTLTAISQALVEAADATVGAATAASPPAPR